MHKKFSLFPEIGANDKYRPPPTLQDPSEVGSGT